MPRNKKAIANQLWKYRNLMGYTQLEVAKRLGIVDTAMISRWEKGLRIPNGENLLKLSILYKTLVNELYSGYIIELQQQLFIDDKNNSP